MQVGRDVFGLFLTLPILLRPATSELFLCTSKLLPPAFLIHPLACFSLWASSFFLVPKISPGLAVTRLKTAHSVASSPSRCLWLGANALFKTRHKRLHRLSVRSRNAVSTARTNIGVIRECLSSARPCTSITIRLISSRWPI
ncbi:hypothetical protein H0G86_001370 [Trichoderma simmonsii]|uniref:Uncharacterized protein n=1 Tax=Trichoderma simmonsii TaxID=1491479 RepID=A0A8G0L1G1_9HYPO|nr:hypothetical protein H0G86_001370 [Trichoderma simmonsii]